MFRSVFNENTSAIDRKHLPQHHSCFKGGGGGTSTIQKADPWEGQQPYLTDVFARANAQSFQPRDYYPNSTIAGFSPEQQWSQQATANRAMMGSSNVNAAKADNLYTLQGGYLNPDSNPWLPYYSEKAIQQIAPQFDSQANLAGRYGSGAWEQMKGAGLGEAVGKIYSDAYGTERNMMNQAAGQAINLGREDYYDLGQLAAVGEEKQAMNQALMDEQKAIWDWYQNEPWDRLNLYNNLIMGHYGGTTQTTSNAPKYSRVNSMLGGGLGGAMAGYGMGSMMGFEPWMGAAGGAGLGSMMGALV